MHVMTRQVQGYQALEENRPFGVRATKKAEEACGGAPIRHHVEYRSELCALVEPPGSPAIERVEKAGERVQECAVMWVVGHEV